ncbi:ABC transporter ATP-binding protein [Desulfonatronospira sp.]|uniref:ABC transporter ATP-binding protein n=1 Tax=Desulfonatronospira sp. TaxID=1962951 RepID=UPI0025BD21B4|nr:ABC transporter ATP-binding protein [Desulfonatronospira sp.]
MPEVMVKQEGTDNRSESRGDNLLDVRDLCIEFDSHGEVHRAVDGISFSIAPGKVLAVVGESGSGKSVTGLSLTGLLPPPPGCRVNGQVLYQGRDLLECSPRELRQYRGRQIAYIFQEPGTALNPVFTIGYQIAEAIRLHRPGIKDVQAEIIKALDLVKIHDPEKRFGDYPHQLSGGMQQRVMIAMALACNPRLLVADEPTTALDVTIQAQIIKLLGELRERLGMSIMLITHNFGIVSGFADKVAVMRHGRIVEQKETARILKNPEHPYTRALIGCIPVLGRKLHRLPTIESEIPGEMEITNG